MKVTRILLFAFIFLYGCSSSKPATGSENMQVDRATFSQWSKPPPSGTDIPERGTDLSITLHNWPEGHRPNYVVYNYMKSYPAAIADSTDNSVTITARIIRTSGVIQDRSESLYLSDRLVFTTPEGETEFIEIENWERAEN